jgi:chromate reductase
MKKIIAFGASSSKVSINKQLATYAAGQFENAAVEILDLNDYEMPIFSTDKETATGIPTYFSPLIVRSDILNFK